MENKTQRIEELNGQIIVLSVALRQPDLDEATKVRLEEEQRQATLELDRLLSEK